MRQVTHGPGRGLRRALVARREDAHVPVRPPRSRAARSSTRSSRACSARPGGCARRPASSSTTSGRPTARACCCSSRATAPSRPTRSARARSGRRSSCRPGCRSSSRARTRASAGARSTCSTSRAAGCEQASPAAANVWEATWCGDGAVVAIASEGAGEGAWYGAELVLIDPVARSARTLRRSDVQLGWACGSPAGTHAAVIEAVCSDRVIVAGQLLLIDPATGASREVGTHGVDVTWSAWRDDERLLAIGVRGLEPVALEVRAADATATRDLDRDRRLRRADLPHGLAGRRRHARSRRRRGVGSRAGGR